VASEGLVAVGAGAMAEREGKKSVESQHGWIVEGSDVPDGRVVGLGLGIGRDVPGELDAGREGARLAAALPDVVAVLGARGRLDADVVRRGAVADVAAVRVVCAVL
jgi:hypothetical protein